MADDETNSGGQDRLHVNSGEDHQVRDGSRKHGCTPDELKAAVKAVGNMAADVEKYLKSRAT